MRLKHYFSVFLCVLFLLSSVAYSLPGEVDVKDWLEPGETWLCEEHFVLDDVATADDYCPMCVGFVLPGVRAFGIQPAAAGDIVTLAGTYHAYRYYGDSYGLVNLTARATTPVWYYYPGTYTAMLGFGVTATTVSLSGTNWVKVSIKGVRAGRALQKSDFTSMRVRSTSSGTTLATITDFSHSFDDDGVVVLVMPLSLSWSGTQIHFQFDNILDLRDMEITTIQVQSDGSASAPPSGWTPGGGGPGEPTWEEKVIEGLEDIEEEAKRGADATEDVRDDLKDDSEGGFLGRLMKKLLDMLLRIFIPEDGYFEGLFERLNQFFSDRLGFLYYPIEHFISWIGRAMSIPDAAPVVSIPQLSFDGHVLIPAMVYTFDFLGTEPFKTIHSLYLMAIDAAMIMAFVSLLNKKWREVMGS